MWQSFIIFIDWHHLRSAIIWIHGIKYCLCECCSDISDSYKYVYKTITCLFAGILPQ